MNRKDYTAIASIISAAHEGLRPESFDYDRGVADALRLAAVDIANVMEKDNARFDRIKFLTACGTVDLIR